MSLRPIAPKIYLGTIADFGDASALQAAGIELAVLINPGGHFPHASANMGALAIFLSEAGDHPPFLLRGLARLLGLAYETKVLAVCDAAGGGRLAAYAITCALAEKKNLSYAAARAIIQPFIMDWAVPVILDAQGNSLWP